MRRATPRIGGQELPPDSPVLAQVAAEERQAYLLRRQALAPLPPPRERTATTEKRWQAKIVDIARRYGYWAYHPMLSQWSEHGWPDLTLLHEGRRRALWIECKTDSGHLSEHQVAVIDRMVACGLEVHVLRPWHGLQAVADILSAS